MQNAARPLTAQDLLLLSAPDDAGLVVNSLLTAASPFVGAAYLDDIFRNLGILFVADTSIIARRLDRNGSQVRVLAAWKDGEHRESWDYDLSGNPCQLPYNGKPTLIPCEVNTRFEKKRDSNYQSFIGLPLHDADREIIGHIAIYSSKRITDDQNWLNIAKIFAGRAEAE